MEDCVIGKDRVISHSFQIEGKQVIVRLGIHPMDKIEAIDICGRNPRYYDFGGWQVIGTVNGKGYGTLYYPNLPFSDHELQGDALSVARDFMSKYLGQYYSGE